LTCLFVCFNIVIRREVRKQNDNKRGGATEMANQIVWCDIPVLNLDRAIKFLFGAARR